MNKKAQKQLDPIAQGITAGTEHCQIVETKRQPGMSSKPLVDVFAAYQLSAAVNCSSQLLPELQMLQSCQPQGSCSEHSFERQKVADESVQNDLEVRLVKQRGRQQQPLEEGAF